MGDSFYEFIGKCGVVLFIIVLNIGAEEFSIIFRGVVLIMLALWFVPSLKFVKKQEGVRQ